MIQRFNTWERKTLFFIEFTPDTEEQAKHEAESFAKLWSGKVTRVTSFPNDYFKIEI